MRNIHFTDVNTLAILGSTITWYQTKCKGKKVTSLISLRAHKRHPISRPYKQTIGHLFWIPWRVNTVRYIEHNLYDDTLQLFGLNINNLLNRCTNTEKPGAATIPVSLPVAALEDQVAHRPPGESESSHVQSEQEIVISTSPTGVIIRETMLFMTITIIKLMPIMIITMIIMMITLITITMIMMIIMIIMIIITTTIIIIKSLLSTYSTRWSYCHWKISLGESATSPKNIV